MSMPSAAIPTLPELLETADQLWLDYDNEDLSHKDLLIGAMDLIAKFQIWAETVNTGPKE